MVKIYKESRQMLDLILNLGVKLDDFMQKYFRKIF